MSKQGVVIVDYRAGNLTSVKLALAALGVEGTVTADPAVVRQADRVIFPGVGAAASAMANLKALGLDDAVKDVAAKGRPFLGICLGMQILFAHSEEDGGVETLGLLPGRVVKFRPADARVKVPQIGWNQVEQIPAAGADALWAGVPGGSEFYFVHSYYAEFGTCTAGSSDYADVVFTAAVKKDNVFATQFHPEKSGRIGLRLLANFLAWEP
ncbi:MAG: imidazole glycerol phosphate synthase subunit HisH [Kiritimatiellia bacterium]